MGSSGGKLRRSGDDDDYASVESLEHVDVELGVQGEDGRFYDTQQTPLGRDIFRYGSSDDILRRIYEYWQYKGFGCIVWEKFFHILRCVFAIVFSTILGCFVNWEELASCEADACNNVTIFAERPLHHLAPVQQGVLFMEGVFATALAIYILKYMLVDVRMWYKTKQFYEYQLNVDENDIYFGVKDWGDLAADLKAWQERSARNHLSPEGSRVLDELGIAQCIMREENYLIALVHTELLKLPLLNTTTIHVVSVVLIAGLLGWGKHRLAVANSNNRSPRGETRAVVVRRMRVLLFVTGVVLLLLAPLVLAWRVVYSVFRYGFALRAEPGRVATRTWSVQALLEFREFNELNHIFELRMSNSLKVAQNYVNQYPTHLERILVLSFTFIMTGLIGFIVILSFLNDGALGHIDVLDKPLLWWLSILTVAVLTAGKLTSKSDTEEGEMFDPVVGFKKISSCTHWKPHGWSDRRQHLTVFKRFKSEYFMYYVEYLVREGLAVFSTPMHLMFHLNSRVGAIVDMMAQCTDTVPGVGDVVAFSTFAFDKYGDDMYGVGAPAAKANVMAFCKDGKMEKSFLTFYSMQSSRYVPPPAARALLAKVVGETKKTATPTLPPLTPVSPQETLSEAGGVLTGPSTRSILEARLPSAQVELMTSMYHAIEDVHSSRVRERVRGGSVKQPPA